MLFAYKIQIVIDVRTVPKSSHNPQYGQLELRSSLQKHEIEYLHLKGLGGLRSTTKDSVNTGWRNLSFRGYADYMQTAQFEESLEELIRIAREKTVAIMCAEAVPWRCHRSLIGDALLVRNIKVQDIMTEKSTKPHELTSFAKVMGHRITYPEEPTVSNQK